MIKLMTASVFALGAAVSAAPVQAQQYNGQYNNQYSNRSLVCTSQNNRYHECSLPFRGRAVLTRQLSTASCVQGRSWGQRRDVVWVSRGCRARFDMVRNGVSQGVDPRRDPQDRWDDNDRNNDGNRYDDRSNYNDGNPYNDGRNGSYAVTCESNNDRMTRCNWDDRYGSPRLVQTLSDSDCQQGSDWGYDSRNGLWVDNGCRARFSNR